MYTWHCIEQLELWYQCVSTFVQGIIGHYSEVNSAPTNQNSAVIYNSFVTVAKDKKHVCMFSEYYWGPYYLQGNIKFPCFLSLSYLIYPLKSSNMKQKLKSKQWITCWNVN